MFKWGKNSKPIFYAIVNVTPFCAFVSEKKLLWVIRKPKISTEFVTYKVYYKINHGKPKNNTHFPITTFNKHINIYLSVSYKLIKSG